MHLAAVRLLEVHLIGHYVKTASHVGIHHLAEVFFHADEYGKTFADLRSVEVPVHPSELITPCQHCLRCSKT